MFVLIFLIPFFFVFLRKQLHVISHIRFLCCHLEISICPHSASFTTLHFAAALRAIAGQLRDDTDAV